MCTDFPKSEGHYCHHHVPRALTNTSFGHSKEGITQVYKQYIRLILSYAHPSWQSSTENTHIDRLQTTKNSALRMATGCTSSTPIHQLYHETCVLPITQHLRLRRTHIYTSKHHNHPLHPQPTHTANTPISVKPEGRTSRRKRRQGS